MNPLVTELLEHLRPSLRSVSKARQLLTDYWADRIALLWTTQDVHRAANETKTVLTEPQARTILRTLHDDYRPQYGLEWADVTKAIEESGLGRDITARELNRLIQRDRLTVDPPPKRKVCP